VNTVEKTQKHADQSHQKSKTHCGFPPIGSMSYVQR
jgi:hypothetical protein